jgi:hypothetical protein
MWWKRNDDDQDVVVERVRVGARLMFSLGFAQSKPLEDTSDGLANHIQLTI